MHAHGLIMAGTSTTNSRNTKACPTMPDAAVKKGRQWHLDGLELERAVIVMSRPPSVQIKLIPRLTGGFDSRGRPDDQSAGAFS